MAANKTAKHSAKKSATGAGTVSADAQDAYRCSFCGRSSHQVQRLIGGPGVFICVRASAAASRSWTRTSR
jgi:hypothetical protein